MLFFEEMWHTITHEPENEPEMAEIQEKIADWIINKTKKA